MSDVITNSLIDTAHSRACMILQQAYFTDDTEDSQHEGEEKRRLELISILSIIAWKVLIPLFTSITGGVTVHIIKEKIQSNKNAKDLEMEVKKNLGHKINEISPENREEAIIAIEEILKSVGATREHARKIFDLLVAEVKKEN